MVVDQGGDYPSPLSITIVPIQCLRDDIYVALHLTVSLLPAPSSGKKLWTGSPRAC